VDVVQGSIYSAGAYADVFYKLESLLRKESRFGVEVQRNIVLAAQGSGKAGKLIPFPAVIELIRTKRFTRVLDLGCGDGTFLVDLCKSNSHVNGYGVDISPEAIADGRHKVAEENLEDRIQLFVEDMFNLKTLKDQLTGVEAATAFFVLHEFLAYETDRVMEFFRTFREMFPNASLIICESVRHTPEQLRKRPGPILEFQLTHDLTGQRPITRQEWQTLFKKAGFTTIEEQYFDFIKTVIYTVH
jgi:2-ketoarginine methyltransferase